MAGRRVPPETPAGPHTQRSVTERLEVRLLGQTVQSFQGSL